MGVKATISDVRQAFSAFTMINEQVKLGQDAAWSVARMLRKLKGHIKDFERTQLKLYKDAGGYVEGMGVQMRALDPLQPGEKIEDYDKRFDAHRAKVNALSAEIEALNEREVDVELDPIKLSLFPKKRKNDKGEEVDVDYNGTHLANCGPFLVKEGE